MTEKYECECDHGPLEEMSNLETDNPPEHKVEPKNESSLMASFNRVVYRRHPNTAMEELEAILDASDNNGVVVEVIKGGQRSQRNLYPIVDQNM